MLEGAGELHRQLGRLRVIRGVLKDRPDPGDEGFGRFQVLSLEGLLGVAHVRINVDDFGAEGDLEARDVLDVDPR
jgi:hypothetical protein